MKRKFERLLAKLKKKFPNANINFSLDIRSYAKEQYWYDIQKTEHKGFFDTIEELEDEVNKICEA